MIRSGQSLGMMEQRGLEVFDKASSQVWKCAMGVCLFLSSTIVIGSEAGIESSNPCGQCTDLGALEGVLVVKGLFDGCSESQSPQLRRAWDGSTGNVAYYRFNLAGENTIVIESEGVSNVLLSVDEGISWSLVTTNEGRDWVMAGIEGSYALAVLAPVCSSATGPYWDRQYRMRLYSAQKVESKSGVADNVVELTEPEMEIAGHLAATGIGVLIPVGLILGIVITTALFIEVVCAISYCSF